MAARLGSMGDGAVCVTLHARSDTAVSLPIFYANNVSITWFSLTR